MSTKLSSQSRSRAVKAAVRPELLRLLDGLPPSKQDELLNFARFLREQETQSAARVELRDVPAESLIGLTGVVALGGDAVIDTEALYDGA